MNKNITIFLLLIQNICFSQSVDLSTYKIEDSIKINIDGNKVKDFKIKDDLYIFLIEDSIITIDKKNKKKGTRILNIEGIDVSKEDITTISSTSNKTLNEDTSQITTKNLFITSYNDGFFTCKFTGNKNIYSFENQIIFIDKNKTDIPFFYLKGDPSGIYANKDKLYYISNTFLPYDYGILFVYDIKKKCIIEYSKLPIIKPCGVYMDDSDFFYTFSKITNQIIKFKKK